ncbi:single-stranded DNA-binding protein [Globicatella sanguinis]
MNRTQLIGNLVSDVEYRQSASGTGVARLRLAVRRNFKNQQNEYDSDFINCVAFGKTAEMLSQYFNKGSKIAVDGRIQTGSYDNKQGQRVYTTDIVIENFYFIESRKQANTQQTFDHPFGDLEAQPVDIQDNLPF